MCAAPYQVNGEEFYERYNEDRPQSQVLTKGGNQQRVDLIRSGGQYFYFAVHARILPSRLPPFHAQLEDVDVYALMYLAHVKKAFSIAFLTEHWSGVFGSTGLPLPFRRQMGRPAILWSQETTSWRYGCVGGSYTFCGGGHLRRVMHEKDLRRTTCIGKRGQFPWQRPCTRYDYGSYKLNIERHGKPVLGLDLDMPVDFDTIDWPDFFDADRSSDALIEWLTQSNMIPEEVREVYRNSTMQARPLEQRVVKRFETGQNEDDTVSEYDPVLTHQPAVGYSIPDRTTVIANDWQPQLKPIPCLPGIRFNQSKDRESVGGESARSSGNREDNSIQETIFMQERPRKKPCTKRTKSSTTMSAHRDESLSEQSFAMQRLTQPRVLPKNQRRLSVAADGPEESREGSRLASQRGDSTDPRASQMGSRDFDVECRILSRPLYSEDGLLINKAGEMIQKAMQIEEQVEKQMLKRANQLRAAAVIQYNASQGQRQPEGDVVEQMKATIVEGEGLFVSDDETDDHCDSPVQEPRQTAGAPPDTSEAHTVRAGVTEQVHGEIAFKVEPGDE